MYINPHLHPHLHPHPPHTCKQTEQALEQSESDKELLRQQLAEALTSLPRSRSVQIKRMGVEQSVPLHAATVAALNRSATARYLYSPAGALP